MSSALKDLAEMFGSAAAGKGEPALVRGVRKMREMAADTVEYAESRSDRLDRRRLRDSALHFAHYTLRDSDREREDYFDLLCVRAEEIIAWIEKPDQSR